MIPLREFKVKSAIRVENKGGSIQAADSQNSTMKRDVQKKKDEMKRAIIKLRSPLNRLNSMCTKYLKIQLLDQHHLYFNTYIWKIDTL